MTRSARTSTPAAPAAAALPASFAGISSRPWRLGRLSSVLFAATGALMSTTSSQQGESIPGISHLVHLVSPGQATVVRFQPAAASEVETAARSRVQARRWDISTAQNDHVQRLP